MFFTTTFDIKNATLCPQNIFICFVRSSKQTEFIYLYNCHRLVGSVERCSVHCAARIKCNRKVYQGARCLGWQSINCSLINTWARTMEFL